MVVWKIPNGMSRGLWLNRYTFKQAGQTVLTVTEVQQAIRILDRRQILQFNSSFLLVYFISHTRPLLSGYPALCTVQIGDSLPT